MTKAPTYKTAQQVDAEVEARKALAAQEPPTESEQPVEAELADDGDTMRKRMHDRADIRNAEEAANILGQLRRRRIVDRLSMKTMDGTLDSTDPEVDQALDRLEDDMGIQIGDNVQHTHNYPPPEPPPVAAAEPPAVEPQTRKNSGPSPVQSALLGAALLAGGTGLGAGGTAAAVTAWNLLQSRQQQNAPASEQSPTTDSDTLTQVEVFIPED